MAAKPNFSPNVLPTHPKIPPPSNASTVPISAAHKATGKNQNRPHTNKKKISVFPDSANVGYS